METQNNINGELKADPDIFIGIVSLVGIDKTLVISTLETKFKYFGYDFVHIRLSDLFKKIAKHIGSLCLDNVLPKDRIEKYIEFGNYIRKISNQNDFWAQETIWHIIHTEPETKTRPIVYVIDQLKTEAELDLLESAYGKAFFQISIYSSRNRRVDYLAKEKAKAENKRDGFPYRAEAEALVNRDYKEAFSYGQKVSKIFELADFIVNIDNKEEHPIEQQVGRFVELLFGSNKYSPNRMEYGIYQAHAASLRSLDLSRQVGAAIFRCTGEIATLGCNEVPKAGGGTYWTDEKYDAREWTKGSDSNDVRKKELLNELESILKYKLSDTEKGNLDKIINSRKSQLNDSQFMDALEYGRIVHAEMNAITDASRLGIPLQDATLYCTTFPCHMCSKLIIASGLKKVIFLEPYPKSLTSDMHPDAVKIEGTSREGYEKYPEVTFTHFYGITANRYVEFFHRGKRKAKNSRFVEYKNGKPKPFFAPYERDRTMENRTGVEYRKNLRALPHRPEPVGDFTKSPAIQAIMKNWSE